MTKTMLRALPLIAVSLMALSLLSACFEGPCYDNLDMIVNTNEDIFDDTELTVVVQNLLHGFWDDLDDQTLDDRLQLVIDGLVDLLPDVVLLQEASVTPEAAHCSVVDTMREELNIALQGIGISYNSIHVALNADPRNGFMEGAAILSQYEILETETREYADQVIFERRHALRATISGASGNIDMVSTHLSGEKPEQADELINDFIPTSENPAIIGGDFNCKPGSQGYTTMIDSGATDVWTEQGSGPGYTGGLDGSITDPDAERTKRIDYLFVVDPEADVMSADLFLDIAQEVPPGSGDFLWASDHIGVVGTIIPPGY